MEKLRWTDPRIALGLFCAAFLVFFSNGQVLVSNDARPNAYVAVSLLTEGDLVISPLEAPFMFYWQADDPDTKVGFSIPAWDAHPAGSQATYGDYAVAGRLKFVGPKYYLVPTQRNRPETGEPLYASTFGFAAGVAAVPALAVARALGADLRRDHAAIWVAAKASASLLVAGSVALVYLSVAGFTSRRRALLLAAAYAFGTCVWALSSQTLWQQTPALFFLALGTLCILRGESAWIRGAAAGLAYSAAIACRPTGALVALTAAAYLFFSDRRSFIAGVLAAIPIVALLLAYNLYYFGSAWEFGQLAAAAKAAEEKTGSPGLWQTPLWLGAAGNLLSPSRGLLVHSPFLAAAFAGAVLAWRKPEYVRLRFLTFAVPALWLPAFAWFDWWGGWSYGYRPIVDSMPLLAVLCVPALDWIIDRPVWRAAFVASIAWSVLVQIVGAFAYNFHGWNAGPEAAADVDRPANRHRLWSFRDWQIAYFLVNFKAAHAERQVTSARWMSDPTW